mmetsp:Transcript_5765/g.24295  ORF Transcript_5765/g.24295 Transcript_5765/m.24295 type:complete len:85 (+) Transcript_5765:358-612(+)
MFRGAEQLMRLVFVSCHSEKSTHRVKLGIHEDTGKTYAVKMMQKSQIRAHEMTNQVRREVRAATQLFLVDRKVARGLSCYVEVG